MNSEHLNALLIDQSFGELPEEVSALLDAYLEQHPESRIEAARTRNALGLTERVVKERPDLFRSEAPGAQPALVLNSLMLLFRQSTPLKVAALLAALGVAAAVGFVGGSRQGDVAAPAGPIAAAEAESGNQNAASTESPWARYRFEDNGRLAVISAYDPESR